MYILSLIILVVATFSAPFIKGATAGITALMSYAAMIICCIAIAVIDETLGKDKTVLNPTPVIIILILMWVGFGASFFL